MNKRIKDERGSERGRGAPWLGSSANACGELYEKCRGLRISSYTAAWVYEQPRPFRVDLKRRSLPMSNTNPISYTCASDWSCT